MHKQPGIYQTVLLDGQGVFMHSCIHLPILLPAGAVIAALSEIDSSVARLLQGVIIMSLFSIRKKKLMQKAHLLQIKEIEEFTVIVWARKNL